MQIHQIYSLKPHTVYSTAWSPDGKILASGSEDNTIKLWEVSTGKMIRSLEGHTNSVSSVAWSLDGEILASGSWDKTIKLWEVSTGKMIRSLEGHTDSVYSAAWSSDGKILASGSEDNTIKLWKVSTGKMIRSLEGHTSYVGSVAWSSDGKILASGSRDNTIKLWKVSTGKMIRSLEGHPSYVRSVAWSSDSKILASGSKDKTIKLWEVSTGKMIRSLEGHTDYVRSVAWSSDGKILASGSYDKTIKLWEVSTGKMIRSLEGHPSSVRSVAWSSDGKILASGSRDNTIKLWEVSTGEMIRSLEGHTDSVYSAAWSSDGKILALGSDDKTIKLWEVSTGKMIRSLEGHTSLVYSAAWSSDGKILASGSDDNTIKLWEVSTGKMIRSLEGHTSLVYSAAWSSDGKILASGSDDNTIKLWEVSTGEMIRSLEGHTDSVRSVAWSSDGKILASGSDDNTIKLWEVSTGKMIRSLEGHTSSVYSAAWSSDGKILASGSSDNTIKLWRSDDWEIAHSFQASVAAKYSLINLSFDSIPAINFPLKNHLGEDILIFLSNTVDVKNLVSTDPAAQYTKQTSAKIVLLGESNVGKSCLASKLVKKKYEELDPTHGMRVLTMSPEQLCRDSVTPPNEKRDIVLWDMGGHGEYRLVHQLFIHDTTLALILLDPTRDAAYNDVKDWNLRLQKRLGDQKATKLLVGSKLDDESASIDIHRINELKKECGLEEFYPTSAKTDRGIAELRKAIADAIDWEGLSKTSRPVLFQRIRDKIENRRNNGDIVLLYSKLEELIKEEEIKDFDPNAVTTVVDQLAMQGMIAVTRLSTGEKVLVLQIGWIEMYAGSIILSARDNLMGVPAVEERIFTSPDMKFPSFKPGERLDAINERIVVECSVQLLIENNICLRHEGLLIFPSLFPSQDGRDRKVDHSISLYYDFEGAIDSIYSSLVVKLAYSERFGRARLYSDGAEFVSTDEEICGIKKIARRGGLAHLDLYFSERVSDETRNLFIIFVEDRLQKEGFSITEVLEITCPKGYRFEEPFLRERLADGHTDVICPKCEIRHRIIEGAKKARESSAEIEKELLVLRTRIERKSKESAERAKQKVEKASEKMKNDKLNPEPIRILHLSDLHMNADDDPITKLQPLSADLRDGRGGLGFDRFDFLVVSGDLTNRATAAEFERVHQFLSALIEQFGLSAQRCLIVPGNHDLSWDEQVYDWKPERLVDPNKLPAGSFSKQGNGYLLRDDKKYSARFNNFRNFYHPLMQQPYPLSLDEQSLAFTYPDMKIQFLTLNSSYEIDEHNKHRSGINNSALSKGLQKAEDQMKAAKLSIDDPILKIAVLHHPVTGNEKIINDAFMGRLKQAGIKIVMHGHVHEERADLAYYLFPDQQIHIVGAGTFGAVAKNRPESTPCLYNVLEVERDLSRVKVHTRSKRKKDGEWEGWAVWPSDKPNERRTYYDFKTGISSAPSASSASNAEHNSASPKTESGSSSISSNERTALIESLNKLVSTQFNLLLLSLPVPNEIVPGTSAPQGDRVVALIKWAESPTGCGLPKIKAALDALKKG